LNRSSKLWLAAIGGLLAILIAAALVLPHSFGLTALSDVVQCLFLLSATAVFLPRAFRSDGRTRLFWVLLSLGAGFWLVYQLFWTYYEIILRRDVPDLCSWDVVIFLHIVPMMAAIALRPHVPRDEYAARVGRLDFALLLVWWFYLYVLLVMPWQYVLPDVAAYSRNLNGAYVAEKLVFLVGLFACCITSKGEWRKLYAGLFGASFCYSVSSTVANWALARKTYYSGSLYDIPLVGAMAWLTWIGIRTKVEKPAAEVPETSTLYGLWVARCSMIAVFSLPLFAAWAISETSVPHRIRFFRLSLTLAAAFCMGIMVFIRQHTLDRQLIGLLDHSRASFENLKRLQAQLVQSEKLASIGQLVGGAAHELNNPITAMLGYSDLLLSTTLTPDQQPLAARIGQNVRRTKSLVASLISFARQGPTLKNPLDLNTLVRTAVKLSQPQWEALAVEVRTKLDPTLPRIMGDSNQLLQVCLQLIANCLYLLSEGRGKIVVVSTEWRPGRCLLQIETKTSSLDHAIDNSANPLTDSLGLSACQGILQEHRGGLSHEFREGALRLCVELPVADLPPAKPRESTVPVLWQSQPFA